MIETTDEAVTYLEMVARRESGDLAEAALIVTRTLRQATQTLADHAQASGVREGDGAGVSDEALRRMAEEWVIACASLVDLVRKARAERDRLRDGKLWLVWSIEHGCWWATDSLGYRGTVEAAGRYTLAEAVRISRLRSPFVDRYGKSHRAEMPIPSPELCALFGVDWDGRALASGEESREPASAGPAEEPRR